MEYSSSIHPSVKKRLLEYQKSHQNDMDNISESPEQDAQREVDRMNALKGNLTGFDCPKCKNKGVVYVRNGSYVEFRECTCMAVRRSKHRIQASGLSSLIDQYTFDSYQTNYPWQQAFKSGAQKFVHDHDRKWFFAGGQPGSGKTHLCTAIVSAFLKQGISARYMIWKDEATKLKSCINDGEIYDKQINALKQVPVLYIDDFFKTPLDINGSRRLPTPGDINLAFELLNYRYNNNCITLLSSERTVDEILDCDEATGSRIYERTKEYCFNFAPDRRKNYRLR